MPALARLFELGEIGPDSIVVGSGRTPFTDESFRQRFEVPPDFARLLFYHQGLSGIKKYIGGKGTFERIVFFLALPPAAYGIRAEELAREGFGAESALIIEKPFGYDYDSAVELNAALGRYFEERQIFRIDHYLAKEAVQNILVFRFANPIFYPVWNSRCIESIQINAFEDIGIGDRAAYFDRSGIIRDMVQNHLTQLLCLLTMEAPVSLGPVDIRAQKLNVLKALRVTDVCRGRYRGYEEERGVVQGSTTETYAELRMEIQSFRWAGTPVFIRAGKAINRKGTEIGIRFRGLPRILFNADGRVAPNCIIFKIQPAEGIVLDLSSKVPGGGDIRLTGTNMAFCYRDSFDRGSIPEAYQRLLLDALRGDKTLFVSAEETELSWRTFGPFLDRGELRHYERGTLPSPCLYRDWIDFEKYGSVCS